MHSIETQLQVRLQAFIDFKVKHPRLEEIDQQTRNSPKCTFSGVVSIDLKRFLASGIALIECPDCARTRTLSPRNGVLRFPAHSKRKTRPPNTEQRWATEKTIWEVVGGERM